MLFAHRFALLAFVFLVQLVMTAQAQHTQPSLIALPTIKTLKAFEGSYVPQFLPETKAPIFLPNVGEARVQTLVCEGCTYDAHLPNLPRYVVYAPVDIALSMLDYSTSGEYVDLVDTLFERTLSQLSPEVRNQHFNINGADWYPASPFEYGQNLTYEGQEYIELIFNPVQVYRDGRVYRQWSKIDYAAQSYLPVPVDLLQQPLPGHPSAVHKTSSATESVLNTGAWFRVGVTNDGVYKIDRALLSNLGVDVNNLDANTLRVFGYGGGMLPQENSVARYDDLPELPLYFPGGLDGRMDDGDAAYFYAQGPNAWRYVAAPDSFIYEKNLYCDTAYYFVNVGVTQGKRMITQPSEPVADRQIDANIALAAIHDDKVSLIKMGRIWFGDHFNTRLSYDYTISASNPKAGTTAKLRVGGAARGRGTSTMSISEGGQSIGTLSFTFAQVDLYYGRFATLNFRGYGFPAERLADGALNLNLTYNRVTDEQAWTDFIELRYQQELRYTSGVMELRTVANGDEVLGFRLQSAPSELLIWDVTDPVNPVLQDAQLVGGEAVFNVKHSTAASAVHQMVAFTPSSAAIPVPFGKVGNQNLHGLSQADYLMVVHPDFMSEAQRLANFHTTQLQRSVHIVTPQQIYNEFSSGRQDVSAIRDFVRMFYTRANSPEERPKFLLLFGDASYDYKGRVTRRPFVPIYEARESFYLPEAFCSDDFYSFLDPNEGFWGEGKVLFGDKTTGVQNHTMDISVGRFPVNNITEAKTMVDKVLSYANSPQPGPWQNQITLIGDHYAGETWHIRDADLLDTKKIRQKYSCANIEKIYLDNYPEEIRPNGEFYPLARQALLQSLQKGQLIVNYTGHGAEVLLSNSRVLEVPDIMALTNGNKLPFWVTATCEFGRFDDPDRMSGAEYLVIQPGGGAIGILTSVRQVFSNQNQALNEAYYDWAFRYDSLNQRYLTLGETYKGTKNQAGGNLNNRSYGLLADPGLSLALPNNQVVVTAINSLPPNPNAPDTLKALGQVSISGEVRNANGALLAGFNGQLYATVFDKPTRYITKQANIPFDWQHNVIFNGLVSVQNGQFNLAFYIPLDISYEIGRGKFSFLATTLGESPTQTAGGCSSDIVVCCTDPQAVPNTTPPSVQLYLNGYNWVSGSTTDASPTLLVELSDDQGINTTGLGVGREIVAFLDDDFSKPIVLNGFYEAKLNNPAAGEISYPFNNLSEGRHKLTVRAWDVTNNSASGSTDFIVSTDPKMALFSLLVYPNPMTDNATFRINHSRADAELEVAIRIVDASGRLVKEISEVLKNGSNLVTELAWDGTLDNGSPITAGLYFYHVHVTDIATGDEALKAASMVVIK